MKKHIFLLVICIIVIATASCTAEKKSRTGLNIIVSILPQKAFVDAVSGGLLDVSVLIPPGGSPATYDPKPSDLARIEQADIYFRVGYIQFERSHVARFAQLNPNMKIIDTSVNVDLRYFGEREEHHHGEEADYQEDHNKQIDPHVWLSPLQVKKQIDVIAQTLADEDPANAEMFIENARKYKAELDELNTDLVSLFAGMQSDKLLVFHPSWGYFAREYGLEQIAIENSGKEPTAEHLRNIINLAERENIRVIFIQSQFNNAIANSIAEEIGAVVISIDPLAEDYIKNLRNAAAKIAENLRRSG